MLYIYAPSLNSGIPWAVWFELAEITFRYSTTSNYIPQQYGVSDSASSIICHCPLLWNARLEGVLLELEQQTSITKQELATF